MISGERGTGACGPGGRYVVVTGHGDMLREIFTVFSGIGIFLGYSAFISHFKTWFALLKWMTLDDSSSKKRQIASNDHLN